MNDTTKQTLVEHFGKIARRRFQEAQMMEGLEVGSGVKKSLQTLFFYVKFDLRIYALSTESQINDVWTFIRNDENMLDFVMGVRGELFSSIPVNVKEFIPHLIGDSYGQARHMGYAVKRVMDSDTHNRLPTDQWYQEVLYQNDWLIVIFLIDWYNLDEGFV